MKKLLLKFLAFTLLILPYTSCLYAETAQDYLNSGAASLGKCKFAQAITNANNALELDDNYTQAYTLRAMAYLGRKEYAQAIADCNKAIELDPKNPEPYGVRGQAYHSSKMGSTQEMIADLTKAIELGSDDPEVYSNRAGVYDGLLKNAEAIADYTKAIELNHPYRAMIYYCRATVYCRLKDYDNSWADVHKAEELRLRVPTRFLEGLKKDSGRDE